MKVKLKDLGEKERMVLLDSLYTAAASVQGKGAVKNFLRDLLTESERVMLGRRIIIARLLIQGEKTREISKRLGVGFDTIARVQKWLSDQMPGYENAIQGLEKEFASRKDPLSAKNLYKGLKKKYPLHFLLFP
ncbi:trp operon repressor [Patescibacteria group bacterium]|nr:trp operon repressor [Patescibacteria group bacterium]